jgi:hypothetical protein
MAIRDELRELAATPFLEMCQVFGVQVDYSARGSLNTVNGIWAVPERVLRQHTHFLGNDSQTDSQRYCIPIQDGWPLDGGPSPEDNLIINSEHYVVREVEVDSLCAIYALKVEKRETHNVY